MVFPTRLLCVTLLACICGCSRCDRPPMGWDEPEETHVPFWESDRQIVEGMDVEDVYGYMSGSLGGSNNYPAIYGDLEHGRLVVSGKAGREVVEDGDVDRALGLYDALLRQSGYIAADASTDPDALVILTMDQIFPSDSEARSAFTAEEFAVLYSKVSPVGPGYAYFSGNVGGRHDVPTMYAWSYPDGKLVVIGRGFEEQFEVKTEKERASAAFRKLLAQRGFKAKQAKTDPDRVPD